MDCIKWSNGRLFQEEDPVHDQIEVTLYNGEEKTGFQTGRLQLTSHRLFWYDKADKLCILEISLYQILNLEIKQVQQKPPNSSRSTLQSFPRIILKLDRPTDSINVLSDVRSFPNSFVQFEFEYGGHNEFGQQINQQLARKRWSFSGTPQSSIQSQFQNIGITGIQRKIQDRLDQQDQQINESFKDLNVLMNQAKEMVNLSNVLISKISKSALNNEESEENEDMKKLKSYFMQMGIIDNPVTKESSGSKYHKALALEINNNMKKVINENGGIMTLADVYCRLNRARGIAGLISAEDLLNACKEINSLNCDLKYNIYQDLNLHVLEIKNTLENNKNLKKICDLVKEHECLTAYALSKLLDCNLIVAKKHLLDAESFGMLCRDDTNMGLRFYTNLFLIK